ncbi:hypothetical protein COT82_00165 [Candidatus Campbellbacteria bacterium CG10_big_fil_rev_8_21_14_0_10_35_52]|uniref:Uncharacterized protein n=1 Tax=Candidatus Campbellbacteria bacterium CG10_big_fil_rev_8_21_14_0_10_35_52 TaxID=1974527 RepID=A0A2M6WW31_9BACT|nr:MAG: hypothetical protein COT82_00165 [Candidatus Campbellbacteria bacterium CG10_big_fil_rev_8_21_14_0_10_35_52]
MEYATLNTENKDETPFLENLSLYIIVGVVFLLPIFFIPSISAPFLFTKSLLIFISILAAFFLFLISKLKRGVLTLPRNLVILTAWAIPLAYFISALFSGNIGKSLLGQGFEIDTFGFFAVMALILSIVPLLFRTKESIFRIYITFGFSFLFLVLFQGLRLIFGADFLSFGIFTNPTANLIGKWNDLGIFFGLILMLSLITMEGLSLNKLYKIIMYIIFVISLFFLSVINFFSVWIVLGIFTLGLFIYNLSRNKVKSAGNNMLLDNQTITVQSHSNKTLIASLIALIISAVFIAQGALIGGYVSSIFKISQIEARPSWQSTIDIAKRTYDENILFGSGPNTFVNQWTLFKPQSINNTLFWNTDFNSGIGAVPTSFITAGLLGGIAWVAFFIIFLYSGFRMLVVHSIENISSYYLSLSLFLSSLYLWIFTVIYTPNAVIITFAFLLTGMYIASLRYMPTAPIEKEISFVSNQRIGFISTLILSVLLIISAVSLYIIGGQYISSLSFQRALIAANIDGNLEKAQSKINSAIKFGSSDKYYRFASELDLARINILLSQEDKDIDKRQTEFQALLGSAISNVQKAIKVDNKNYQNWSMLGIVYGSMVPFGVEGAYENAKQTYEKAITLNPSSPLLYLALARLELSRPDANTDEAKRFISLALNEKNDYTEAIFLLSQIQVQSGDIQAAIKSAEAVAFLEPNNPVFLFQLGLLHSNVGDNEKAIFVLEKAIALNNNYSNARYFLGLNYFKTGKVKDATEQFKIVSDLNPDNQEVKTIIQKLTEGKDPFGKRETNDGLIERDTLPIEGE